ncbi:MAG: NAD(+) synthase [Cyclobacteriaceae bacterium]|nr:NAD(+) synthase [Cyclobacteriaceae bacterium]
MSKIKVAGAALNQIPFDWNHNLDNILEAIRRAKEENVKILCLPELCITGYGCEDMFLSEWLPAQALECLKNIIPYTSGITVAAGLPMRLKSNVYNCIAVIENGSIKGFTAKQLLANDGVHYEPRWFSPWEAGKTDFYDFDGEKIPFGDLLYTLHGIKTGFEICEDAWRPNRPAVRMLGKGVSLILNPSASHFAFGKTMYREELVRSSSEEFNCYYLYANLLGNEAGRMIYDGEIFIAGHGCMVAENKRLSYQSVNLLAAEIDVGNTQPQRNVPAIREIKNDAFVQATSLALFDYLRKSRSNGFVLSLSGGADSSTCAVLVSEMIRRAIAELGLEVFLQKIHKPQWYDDLKNTQGKDLVQKIAARLLSCAYQASANSSEQTRKAAASLAAELGATYYEWSIENEVRNYTRTIETAIERKLDWQTDDISLQNIQARARSPIIWMLANINNALLITTSNRSEGDVGYTTMDGDTSGSIAPIAAVDKHFVIQWLKWAEKELDYPSLTYVNSLQPTAELRPSEQTQTDEKDLMPYRIMVEIEKLAIRDRKHPAEVFKILLKTMDDEIGGEDLKKFINRFFTLWSRNQWKRERLAPSFHLDDFNVDPRTWCRFPILSSGFEKELEELNTLHE